jgi:LysM repeat protein
MRNHTAAVQVLVYIGALAVALLTALYVWDISKTTQRATAPAATQAETVAEAIANASSSTPLADSNRTQDAAPILYSVRPGDTLSAIANAHGVSVEDLVAANALTDPNLLQVDQVLVIPPSGVWQQPATTADAQVQTATPSPAPPSVPPPTPHPTLTPAGPPQVSIYQVLGSGAIADESVLLRNEGGAATLHRWTLSNSAGETFTFPALTLYGGAELRVHTRSGTSTPTDLFWDRVAAVWQAGSLITLRDAGGTVVDTYVVP